MLDLSSEIQAELNARSGVMSRVMWWLSAKNRTTGELEYMGIWTGDDHQTFTINGEPRVYYGAGNLLNVDTLVSEAVLNIRNFNITFSGITPELETALREYDPKFAPVEVHVAFFSPLTGNMVSDPVRMFKGWINKAPINTPPVGGQGTATVQMVGHTRLLTKKTASKRSNENQKKRNGSDTFFKDVSITGSVVTPWGTANVKPAAAPSRNVVSRLANAVAGNGSLPAPPNTTGITGTIQSKLRGNR